MKLVRWILITLYVYFILTRTIIGRVPVMEPIFRGFFWEVKSGYWHDIAMNILLFVPFGFLVGGKKGIAFGFLFSLGIETAQYYFRLGFCEMDDILNNTLGALLGVTLRSIFEKILSRGR